MEKLPERKRLRLADYDYSGDGYYYITVCTQGRRRLLSDIAVGEGLAPPEISLSAVGMIVEEQIRDIPRRYPHIKIDKYVIMPNHIHLIVSIRETAGGASPSPTLSDAVRALKSMTARLSRPHLGADRLWQRSFYEHVIRNESDYREIWEYIDNNPAKWADDEYSA